MTMYGLKLIETTVIRTAVDLGIFKILTVGDVQMTAEEIATVTGADQVVTRKYQQSLTPRTDRSSKWSSRAFNEMSRGLGCCTGDRSSALYRIHCDPNIR